ncbi:MAG: D-sedoheptulose 7-phosphate isomerase [Gammaproteobacteria bacterium]|nr:D-sedoheptulose 7-phosphate isomerase [Gammaproteobacteria bacterium]
MLDTIKSHLKASCAVKQQILANNDILDSIRKAAVLCIEALKNGRKVMLAGNGGSAADAQHIAAELVGRFETERPGLPALALSVNTSTVTAVANDYNFNNIFRRQVQALGQAGDIFIGISTSGNSANVIAAIEQCKTQGITVIGMTGESGGKMRELCDLCIRVPASNTARIQESHITIGHIICSLIDSALTAG